MIGLSQSNAQISAKLTALNQSVVAVQGSKEASCGTFRTMESLRYGDGGDARAVQVKIEQPLCEDQQGAVALVNPSGADWKYKVIRREGSLVSEGQVGYNRRIGSLPPGSYLIQFSLPDGTSALDEFSVKPPKGMVASMEFSKGNIYVTGSELQFSATCSNAEEFIWDFGDGTAPIYGNAKASHQFAKPGAYTVSVTANNFDCSSSISKQVIVTGVTVQEDTEK